MSELYRCPFCGGCAHLTEGDGRFFAACDECFCAVGEAYDGCAMPNHCFYEEEAAIAAWNTRSDTALTRIRDLEELAGTWREQAKRHDDAASTADEIAMGDDELCIHLECSRVYGACADALLAALSSKDQEKTNG